MTRLMDPVPQSRRLARGLPILTAWGLVSWLAGCSVIVDANRAQCSTNADCAKLAGSVCTAGLCVGGGGSAGASGDLSDPLNPQNPRWACNAVLPANSTGYKVTMHLTDAIDSTKVLPGVNGLLCRNLDVECENPVGAMATSDETGMITLQVEKGFDGFVQLTSPKIAPSMYFLTPPASGDLELPMVPLASPFAASSIVLQAGGNPWAKDTSGIVLLTAFDCTGTAAAGLNFSIGGTPDPKTFIFYLVGGYPTTTVSITDDTGYGGLVNVPAGVATVSALLGGPSGHKVSKISVLVRAGYVSYSAVTPNSL
ncbi:MAG TPA: hypothetical protein VER96_37865 [Polyangiaceae bacterium]|nr:hypothetical protein [Polyangiaceae bacterium]